MRLRDVPQENKRNIFVVYQKEELRTFRELKNHLKSTHQRNSISTQETRLEEKNGIKKKSLEIRSVRQLYP